VLVCQIYGIFFPDLREILTRFKGDVFQIYGRFFSRFKEYFFQLLRDIFPDLREIYSKGDFSTLKGYFFQI